MINFTDYSSLQVVQFIADNSSLFASELSEDFPRKIIRHLAGDLFQTITRQEGFAFIDRGISNVGNLFPGKNAELMFLYVKPEFEGVGIGTDLKAKAKACLPEGRIMELTCEGEKRYRYFERKGFELIRYDEQNDLYHLEWSPS